MYICIVMMIRLTILDNDGDSRLSRHDCTSNGEWYIEYLR